MFDFYHNLSSKHKIVAWIALIALIIVIVSNGGDSAGLVAGAQVAAATGTLILASLAYSQLRELRETRIGQERPQVIVDTDHSRPPFVYTVVRNIGKGAAKNITFEFSAPMESPESADIHSPVIPVSEQPYFVKGIEYLAPGAEIPCFWGSMINLAPFLRERGFTEGVTIISRYKSLTGEEYETSWTVNPLLIAGRISTPRKGINEIAESAEQISKLLNSTVDTWNGELRVSIDSERQQRDS